MDFKQIEDKYFIRVDKNEEIIQILKDFCHAKDIKAGVFKGIGAVKSITLGFFNPETKKYSEKTFNEFMEIACLIGNISRKENQVYLHAHMSASGADFNVIGGHLVNAVPSATAEICLIPSNGELNRKFDEEIGLNIYDF
jgi:hypothetical protein